MFYEVIPTKIFRKGSSALTYLDDKNLGLEPGSLVLIPLGKSSCPGIVLKRVQQPPFPCKPIKKLLYNLPLPPHLLKALSWLSSYYLSPLPSVASLLLPVGIEKKRRTIKDGANSFNFSLHKESKIAKQFLSSERGVSSFERRPEATAEDKRRSPVTTGATDAVAQNANDRKRATINLNAHQLSALTSLNSITTPTKLLFGITGSGKTNIYLKLTDQALNNNQSTILLVPEIALTSQLVDVFSSVFGKKIVLLHSKQTESERHLLWEFILTSTEPLIVIGPRSALFAPLKDLGLIIIDEAHESAYYQENSPKYSALRLASFLAKTLNISCVLGSATPLVSDFFLAKKSSALVSLTEKAKTSALEPKITIVDSTSRDNFRKNRYFSDPLLETLKTNLKNHHQTLIYHNRRGSAPLTLCESCGWQALCPACFLPLTLHSDSYSLLCHTCGFAEKLPSSCPDCGSPSILHKGFGTKLLELELNKLFPEAKIARFDADNKKSETLDKKFTEVKNGDFDIIIGTQTVSRGLDLPLLASIGIVQADSGLSLPDFSAEEKTFELLTQVIGRVGRGHLSTASVIIQTFRPADPVISFAKSSDYLGFYHYLIKKRQTQSLPPFTYLAKVSVTYKTEAAALKNIRAAARTLNNFIIQNSLANSIKISPPMPCFHEHTSSGFSWQLILKGKRRTALIKTLGSLGSTAHISLDPPSLL